MVGRLEIVAEEEWIESVRAAAQASGGLSMSSYIRLAVAEKMRRDGGVPPATDVRPAHRPAGTKGRKRKGKE